MSKPELMHFPVLSLALGLACAPADAQLFPELRSIPSESMLPTLVVGDRVEIKRVYRDGKLPERGDVVIFNHPHNPRVMIRRVIGLPGDTVEMKGGRLLLNGKEVPRTPVRDVVYRDDIGSVQRATEYSEQLPGEERAHRIFEFSNHADLDETPVFKVPPGHYFMMGDSRDNSEDSRAPTGHRSLAAQFPEAWPYRGVNLRGDPKDDAHGFVPLENVIGRATSVFYSLNGCLLSGEQKARGVVCLKSNVGKPL